MVNPRADIFTPVGKHKFQEMVSTPGINCSDFQEGFELKINKTEEYYTVELFYEGIKIFQYDCRTMDYLDYLTIIKIMNRKANSAKRSMRYLPFVGCSISYSNENYNLICEVESQNEYKERFFVNGEKRYEVRNRGNFPADNDLLKKKFYYYKNQLRKDMSLAANA